MLATPDLEISFALNRQILRFYEEVASSSSGHVGGVERLAGLLEVDTSTAQRIIGKSLVSRFMQSSRWTRALVDSFMMGKPAALVAPRSIRLLAESHGFRIHRLKSSALWGLFSFLCLAKGVAALARILAQSAMDSLARTSVLDASKAVYLDGLVPAAAHLSKSTDMTFTFFSWCKNNTSFFGSPSVFYSSFLPSASHQPSDVLFAYASRPYFLAIPFRGFVIALWNSSRQVFLAAYLALRGQIALLMLLSQLVLVTVLKRTYAPYFFQTYVVTTSNLNNRPLWTYGFERAGGKVAIVHYSTNMQPWVLKVGTTNPSYAWKATNWPWHWVWSDSQGVVIQKMVGAPTNVKVVGPVWFEDSESNLPEIPPRAVAIFDVVPRRPEVCRYLLLETNVYTSDAIIRFHEDCFEVLRSLNLIPVVKNKRKVAKVEDPTYRSFLSRLSEREDVLLVDSGVSPFRLLPHCVAAISIPFSSPSVIAKSLGLPSFFYDPTQSLDLVAYVNGDIPLINNHAKLEKELGTALGTKGAYDCV